ncbi:2,3-bisphosphoglycerate-independent phosphoglycerate mutase [Dehalobacter sp. UNSWDHB]|uniref:2,3-bisphosphoglycerate-independent phosphoglycerate mutase n=1 Tax=unclassified Dehalobacter TaxID=2635733 RepID=UPI00028AD401|nr:MULTISPECIES: 2,3-bisphosphoglycerate-independent phosphoglycerate mutase [unclassified Dehalobacter]AFV03848.1 2,3-bisphosphoglycerate-independent phosphoglycerate mutase [Dehalobacter sp. DCA]AFV06830.1 2,3-bisphosphoglycerate-independent phosphoglycerate mutase [Dehalobacter sp. CF]EQB21368.1 2,3-bisphosphoglycerate-independent phosphoglycerate mutase [Dehalobacter sp. UNSWDHB]MCM1567269.1 2,3-bisphosphoglycerate-independent phosphoglycerate mutase [Dehalobacter sp.]
MSEATGRPLLLMILDGWGCSKEKNGNATLLAKIPNFSRLQESYPHTLLNASGAAVGLPEGQMGNSEVGHLNIGAGRVVYQELTRIFKAMDEGDLVKNEVLREAMTRARDSGKAFHLLGLLSDGGVHSHIRHLFALLDMAVEAGVEKIYIHPVLDGRDVLPQSAKEFIRQLENKLKQLGRGKIATVSGRYYVMDRDKRWDRVEKAYKALVAGEGPMACNALAAVENAYDKKIVDEFVDPTVITDESGRPVAVIENDDSVLFFNFRADRAREITRAFIEENFEGFIRTNRPRVHYVCLTEYDASFDCPVVFPPQNLENTLGEALAAKGLRQLRIAETEKYAHVTFFFNGGIEEPEDGEDRCLIPSPGVPTYNLQPEMSAYGITEALLSKVREDQYDVIVLNFANADMIGHTGYLLAAVKALEAVDVCIGKIVDAVQAKGGTVLITSDHGNAECMIDQETNSPFTAHTTNKVPFILVNDTYKDRTLREGGSLCDIAPTMLKLLKLDIPAEMTGKSLLLY